MPQTVLLIFVIEIDDKNVVCLILKRYVLRNFKIWSYAVRSPKKRNTVLINVKLQIKLMVLGLYNVQNVKARL